MERLYEALEPRRGEQGLNLACQGALLLLDVFVSSNQKEPRCLLLNRSGRL